MLLLMAIVLRNLGGRLTSCMAGRPFFAAPLIEPPEWVGRMYQALGGALAPRRN